mgnify:CR=1 FL=1|tara:strand:- start:386 stop:628 length:243 start_codon:yes stop_codon:yes gene_type:complete
MEISYFIRGVRFSIKSHWFTEECMAIDHEVDTLIMDCASNFYENNSEVCWFPAEITVCVGNKQFGSRIVELDFKPVFEIQ